MKARFYVDPATGWPHIHNHQVDEGEVIDVLEKPGEDRPGREGSRIALGLRARQRVRNHGIRTSRQTSRGLSQAQKEETAVSQEKLPEGWDDERVRRVIAHYENQTEDEALAEDQAGIESSATVMNVPRELVSKVRELIAKHQSR